ncbi:hypothetical protein BKA70DRAFT_472053 [Coprinopsis sp. MPI-PUGE-AT-0042]|nr:hypothetical protein BKA70DRAFT_472053 [Coprinopsis sp. MPI-PUGE-AT-0042]
MPISFPFSLSYLIMTPGRVRLPGEKKSNPPPSPTRSRRWSVFSAQRFPSTGINRDIASSSRPSRDKNEADSLLEEDAGLLQHHRT